MVGFGPLLDIEAPVVSGGDFCPPADDTFDLGSSTRAWKDGHFDGVIYTDDILEHGSGQGVTIEGVLLKDNDITLTGGESLFFRGTSEYIYSISTGKIKLMASGSGADDFIIGCTTEMADDLTLKSGAQLIVDDTTDSSSITTGSIQTDGGLGVVKKSYFGDHIRIKRGKQLYFNYDSGAAGNYDHIWSPSVGLITIQANGTGTRDVLIDCTLTVSDAVLMSAGLGVTGNFTVTTGHIYLDAGKHIYFRGSGDNYQSMWSISSGILKIQTSGTGYNDLIIDGTIYAMDKISVGSAVTGIDFIGTYTSHVIDFSDATQAAGDISLIRAGSYGSPMDVAGEAQYGMVRLYLSTDDDGTSYNRGVFVCLKTAGTKGIFPIAGLAEVLAQSGNGPTQVGASQFIADLFTATSKVDARGTAGTANFYGAWLKVGSKVGSEARSGSVVTPVWLDTQMNGTVNGEMYAAYITTGTHNDAVFGFEETGGGGHWDNLFYFDDTTYDQLPVNTNSLAVLLNTTQYYIPLSTTAGGLTTAYPIVSTVGITGTIRAVDITTTTSVTSGNSIALEIEHTRDTDSVTGRDWGIKVTMISSGNAKFPGGVNAIYGSLELGTGGAHGRAAGLQGELVMPDGQLTRGTFSCLHADLTESANTNTGSSGPISFISCMGGGTLTNFDARGNLFEITGFTSGSGKFYYNNTLRMLVAGTTKYLPLSTTEGKFTGTLGVITASGDITLSDIKIINLKAGTSAINPESAHRGQFYFTEGVAGVADLLYCIMKGTDNNYTAIQVAIG